MVMLQIAHCPEKYLTYNCCQRLTVYPEGIYNTIKDCYPLQITFRTGHVVVLKLKPTRVLVQRFTTYDGVLEIPESNHKTFV